MAALPCVVCGAGALTSHCEKGKPSCGWDACPTCDARVDRLHKDEEGRPRHSHGRVQRRACLLCSPRKAET